MTLLLSKKTWKVSERKLFEGLWSLLIQVILSLNERHSGHSSYLAVQEISRWLKYLFILEKMVLMFSLSALIVHHIIVVILQFVLKSRQAVLQSPLESSPSKVFHLVQKKIPP